MEKWYNLREIQFIGTERRKLCSYHSKHRRDRRNANAQV